MFRPSSVLCLSAALLVLHSLFGPAAFSQDSSNPGTLSRGGLQDSLKAEDPGQLAADVRAFGDAKRGAIVFYQTYMTCTQCHQPHSTTRGPGPDLASGEPAPLEHLLESLLEPSKKIKKGYETLVVITTDGKQYSGTLVREDDSQLVLRDAKARFEEVVISKRDIEERAVTAASLMPDGLMNQMTSRQQFLDLALYLAEIAEQGRARARELEPDPALYAARPLPAYESELDHAGIIADWDQDSYRRGEAIYQRLCVNCHGTREREGSLPTSLRFAEGKFKNGSDPYTMYQTLTRGFGMMVPQTWMVPQQKYDVIHYIREAYLKPHNPDQYFELDPEYLSGLPTGTERGPAPSNHEPWVAMDYGPSLINTYEVGEDGSNFAYKGIAVRLDPGPGGVSRGRYWMVLDHDTMRMAAAWSGEGFIDWNGIHFNGRHQVHPRLVGAVHVQNPTGPGWANAEGSFEDVRLEGRDGRRYGPLPRNWARYRGLHHVGSDTIVEYDVNSMRVQEMPRLLQLEPVPVFARTLRIAPSDSQQILQVAQHQDASRTKVRVDITGEDSRGPGIVKLQPPQSAQAESTESLEFDGSAYVEIGKAPQLDLHRKDFTIRARFRTKDGGTILAETSPGDKWVPNGKVLFIRDGRLCFDIGWVGVVQSRDRRLNDGRWHEVAMTWKHEEGLVQLYVDGRLSGKGTLRADEQLEGAVVRLGFAAPNFPNPSKFRGELQRVMFYQQALSPDALAVTLSETPEDQSSRQLRADWVLDAVADGKIADRSGHKHLGTVQSQQDTEQAGALIAGVLEPVEGMRWTANQEGAVRLVIPPHDTVQEFTVWFARGDASMLDTLPESVSRQTPSPIPLEHFVPESIEPRSFALKRRSRPRWNQRVTTQISAMPLGDSAPAEAPFEVDVLTRPTNNPWHAQVRLTGHDFFPDGDRAAVCAWDGDVWLVSGLLDPEGRLQWQRIASGLFQPLGVKLVNGQLYVTCRDQLVILHDRDGDGETDYYECFNNDHQVTDHFHEFAMGLQRDANGNFYYAKSARHALPALVPHHGTLLRVSPDGERTEILATGFRAANGVCLNPDGTYFVTDQEGHWMPKNRINWVREGGFYGNMFGYHDITDSSDEAMEPPLCWITNGFDRSPAELLWVDSPRWGPLHGSLLSLSYGYGKIFVVPHERLGDEMQGGMCALPLPRFPTGIMRGRFSPVDGQLYTSGMFAWAGNQQQPGGFYRVRYTGAPVHLPLRLQARPQQVTIRFSGEIADQPLGPEQFRVRAWDLKRTANYGSQHHNERTLEVTEVSRSADRRTVTLTIPQLQPTWGMSIQYEIPTGEGQSVRGEIHNTIHRLPKTR